tara:strand:- start:412 stop:621 length:210 start_codon:yes stop_codon:yes gene_type:complete
MALSRKYYQLLAKEINELYLEVAYVPNQALSELLDKLINNLAIKFKEDNANFNHELFLKACLKDVTNTP